MAGSDPETTLGRLLRRLPHEASCDGLAPITGRSTKPASGCTLSLTTKGPLQKQRNRKCISAKPDRRIRPFADLRCSASTLIPFSKTMVFRERAIVFGWQEVGLSRRPRQTVGRQLTPKPTIPKQASRRTPSRQLCILSSQAASTFTVTLVMLYSKTAPPVALPDLNRARLMPSLTELRYTTPS